jgi:hypothetical protein
MPNSHENRRENRLREKKRGQFYWDSCTETVAEGGREREREKMRKGQKIRTYSQSLYAPSIAIQEKLRESVSLERSFGPEQMS